MQENPIVRALLALMTTPSGKLMPTWAKRQEGKHVRSGITKNHGQGQSASRRRMTKLSRRKNR